MTTEKVLQQMKRVQQPITISFTHIGGWFRKVTHQRHKRCTHSEVSWDAGDLRVTFRVRNSECIRRTPTCWASRDFRPFHSIFPAENHTTCNMSACFTRTTKWCALTSHFCLSNNFNFLCALMITAYIFAETKKNHRKVNLKQVATECWSYFVDRRLWAACRHQARLGNRCATKKKHEDEFEWWRCKLQQWRRESYLTHSSNHTLHDVIAQRLNAAMFRHVSEEVCLAKPAN